MKRKRIDMDVRNFAGRWRIALAGALVAATSAMSGTTAFAQVTDRSYTLDTYDNPTSRVYQTLDGAYADMALEVVSDDTIDFILDVDLVEANPTTPGEGARLLIGQTATETYQETVATPSLFTLESNDGTMRTFRLTPANDGTTTRYLDVTATAADISDILFTGANVVLTNPTVRGGAVRLVVTDDTNGSIFENVVFSDNSFAGTADGTEIGVYGAGLYAIGANAGGADTAILDLSNVDFLDNSATVDATSGNTAFSHVSGGGARIVGMSDVLYETGTVSGNSVTGSQNVWKAAGGGLTFEFNDGNTFVEIDHVDFSDNTASLTRTAAVSGVYAARGGALHVAKDNAVDTGFTDAVVFDSTFTGNQAIGYGNASAMGGAAEYLGAVSGVFYQSTLDGNQATTEAGNAYGGAVALESYSTATGNLTGDGQVAFVDTTLTNNLVASDSGSAYGGAVHVASMYDAAGDGTYNAVFVNSMVTDNSASTSGPVGTTEARGGAAYFDTMTNGGFAVLVGAFNGEETVFSGNTDMEGANSLFFSGSGSVVLDLVTDTGSAIRMEDPIQARLLDQLQGNGEFTLNVLGDGVTYLDGMQNLTANNGTNINVASGATLSLMEDAQFFAPASQNTIITMADPTSTLLFDWQRNGNLAMIDGTSRGPMSPAYTELNANGATLGVDMGRRLSDLQAGQSYLLLDKTGDNSDPFGSYTDDWTHGTGVAAVEARDSSGGTTNYDQLWIVTAYAQSRFARSVYSNINTSNAAWSIDQFSAGLSAAEWAVISTNLRVVTAEYAMSSALANRGVSQAVANTVINDYFRRDRPTTCRCPAACQPAAYADPCAPACESGYGMSCRCSKWNLWGGYIGNFGNMHRGARRESYETDLNGLIIGADRKFDRTTLGLYGSYMGNDLKYRSIAGGVDSDGFQFAGLLRRDFGHDWSFVGDVGYGHFNNNGWRAMWDNANYYRAAGSFDQDLITAGAGIEKYLCYGRATVMPYLRTRYTYLSQEGMTEHGNSSLLSQVDGFNGNSFTMSVGSEFSRECRLGDHRFTPRLRLAWVHEFGDTDFWSDSRYLINPADTFGLTSAKENRDRFEWGIDAKSTFTTCRGHEGSLFLAYDYLVSNRVEAHNVSAGMLLQF